jgi:hypothetical protein
MDEAVIRPQQQMKLRRPRFRQQHVARLRHRDLPQPRLVDRREDRRRRPAAQRIATGYALQRHRPRHRDQPDTVQPECRIAPLRPEPHTDAGARPRHRRVAHLIPPDSG